MAKRVQVVLNEDVLSLGKDGDLVEVAPGYARNFLLPTGKAQAVTSAVLRQVEARRAKEAERQAAQGRGRGLPHRPRHHWPLHR